mgnify:CR=1 FL=1
MLKLMEVETCGLHKRNSGSDVSQLLRKNLLIFGKGENRYT